MGSESNCSSNSSRNSILFRILTVKTARLKIYRLCSVEDTEGTGVIIEGFVNPFHAAGLGWLLGHCQHHKMTTAVQSEPKRGLIYNEFSQVQNGAEIILGLVFHMAREQSSRPIIGNIF